jgi:hypothetical protein
MDETLALLQKWEKRAYRVGKTLLCLLVLGVSYYAGYKHGFNVAMNMVVRYLESLQQQEPVIKGRDA